MFYINGPQNPILINQGPYSRRGHPASPPRVLEICSLWLATQKPEHMGLLMRSGICMYTVKE